MKKANQIFSKIKKVNDEMFLKEEKITIVNKEKIYIQNYQDIKEITEEKIQLGAIIINGKQLKIVSISKYFVEINGIIDHVSLGDVINEE